MSQWALKCQILGVLLGLGVPGWGIWIGVLGGGGLGYWVGEGNWACQ